MGSIVDERMYCERCSHCYCTLPKNRFTQRFMLYVLYFSVKYELRKLFMFKLDFLIQLSKFNFNLIIIIFIGCLFFDQLTHFSKMSGIMTHAR